MHHPGVPGDTAESPLPDPVFERLTRWVATLGGVVSVATAVLVTVSVTRRWLGLGSINGDFELVQMGVALSVFCFLPITQARRGNIMVDTFTSRLPRRAQRAIDAFWDLVYAGFMALVAWCIMNGARDALASGLTSSMLGLPLWPVFGAAVILVVLLAATAIDTAAKLLQARP